MLAWWHWLKAVTLIYLFMIKWRCSSLMASSRHLTLQQSVLSLQQFHLWPSATGIMRQHPLKPWKWPPSCHIESHGIDAHQLPSQLTTVNRLVSDMLPEFRTEDPNTVRIHTKKGWKARELSHKGKGLKTKQSNAPAKTTLLESMDTVTYQHWIHNIDIYIYI